MENYSISPIERRNTIFVYCVTILCGVITYINATLHHMYNTGGINIQPNPETDFFVGVFSLIGGVGFIVIGGRKSILKIFRWGSWMAGFILLIWGTHWTLPGMVTAIKVIHLICTVAMIAITIAMIVKYFLNSRK